MKFDPDKHHRRSIRLPGYDYSREGMYFVTICVLGKVCALGEIHDGAMMLNTLGCVVDDCWRWLAEQYPYVQLDEYVIMPNHLHGIIIIREGDDGTRRGASRSALVQTIPTQTTPTKRKPLGRLIGAFKTISTKHINHIYQTPGERFWQRNYYEHIVRTEERYQQIRQYIMTNPQSWADDTEYNSPNS
jgi:putative transposase